MPPALADPPRVPGRRSPPAIDHLAALVDGGETVFVLCFGHDQECCHRAQIIDAVDSRRVPEPAGALALMSWS